MNCATYSIKDVANWFLQHQTMQHKKLQKLCYYAQAWGLVFYNCKIINGEFEAWVHGPVNRSLWNDLKGFGYCDIPQNYFSKTASTITCATTKSLLESVWEAYGKFTGFELERLSHTEKPWIEARGDLPDSAATNRSISLTTMKEYYSSLLSGEGVGE